MPTALLLALALTIRSLPSVDGVVDCSLKDGQQVVSAYSATFEPIWHQAVPTTIVDRTAAAQAGKVTGLGAADRLVLAITDDNLTFDASRPVADKTNNIFPYSPALVQAYEAHTGRNYLRDMMVVVVPTLGSQLSSITAVSDLYETLFAADTTARDSVRSFGSGEAGSVLVITSRARTWCWLDRCFGDDGSTYAKKLAAKGFRVDLLDLNAFAKLVVDKDGFVTFDGRRCQAMVLRHLSVRDADAYRHIVGNRPLQTKVYATDTPVLYGAELSWSDPDL